MINMRIPFSLKSKCSFLVGILFLLGDVGFAQSSQEIRLDSCQVWARNTYPLIVQFNLIQKSETYSVDNVSKMIWPQIQIGGQASYQSDVTQLNIPLPGFSAPEISKDQYKIYGEVMQPLTDIITVNNQKKLVKANAAVERQKTEIEFHKLKERVNQLYFGILLLNSQIKQTELIQTDIKNALKKTEAAIKNGVATQVNSDVLQAEILKINQRKVELISAKKTYLNMLAMFTQKPINEQTQFVEPKEKLITTTLKRPELSLFEYQKRVFDAQENLINSKNLPRFSLFLQSGYGRPALNMLNNDFDFFYIGGLRLNWNLSSFYTSNKEKKLVSINQSLINTQKEVFVFNTNLQLTQLQGELEKIDQLMKSDKEIIALRERIKLAASVQLENGTSTAVEFLSLANAEDQARQNLELHRIQHLMTQYNHELSSGN